MKKLYCNGKKGYCERYKEGKCTICDDCEFFDGEGSRVVDDEDIDEGKKDIEMPELELCPFCGAKAQKVVDDATEEKFIIQCTSCKAMTWEYEYLQDAVNA